MINHSMNNVIWKFNSVLPQTEEDRGGVFVSNLAKLVLARKLTEAPNEQKLIAAYEGLDTLLNKESNLHIKDLVDMSKNIINVYNFESVPREIDVNTLLWIADKYTFPYSQNVYKIDSIDNYLTVFLTNCTINDEKNIFVCIDITHKCRFAQNKTKDEGHQFVYDILFADGNYNGKSNPFILRIKKSTILIKHMTFKYY